MKIVNRLYSIYAIIVFFVLFLFLFPLFFFFIKYNKRHRLVFLLHNVWAHLFFGFIFMPVKKIYKERPEKGQQYVFCANHFSFMDIPVMSFTRTRSVFVGKSSLGKVPLFGYMYKKIHITLDREKLKSRYQAMNRYLEELDKGISLIIFPEGGIAAKNPPKMERFKDGAFRAAIEKQIPIVPVTIPYNWIILRDDGKFFLRWHRSLIIYHEKIETKGMTINNLEELKSKTYDIIQQELNNYNKHANRQRNT